MLFVKPRRIDRLRIVIVGAGEVGYHIAMRLSGENKQVVVIDQNAEALLRVQNSTDAMTLIGSGASPKLLAETGLDDSSVLLAVTDSDDINLLACLFANAIAPKALKLARIRSEEYTAYAEVLRSAALNISLLVNPEEEIVAAIDRQISLPGAVEYGEFEDGRIRVMAVRLDGTERIAGTRLANFRDIAGDGAMIAGIARGQDFIVPSGSDHVEAGDLVYFVYLRGGQNTLLSALNRERARPKSICIVGGGNIGRKLAERLSRKGLAVKLIEKDADRCAELADKLHGVLVLHGDGTDKQLLEEESIAGMSVLAAVTGNEETNILSCLLAKSLGLRETVARVDKAAYVPLVEAVGIEHSISPRLAAVNSFLHYLRPGGIMSSLSLRGEAGELFEVEVAMDSSLAGQCVSDLGLPKGVLFLSMLHEGEIVIPSGKTRIHGGDRIVMLAARDRLSAVEQMLSRTARPGS